MAAVSAQGSRLNMLGLTLQDIDHQVTRRPERLIQVKAFERLIRRVVERKRRKRAREAAAEAAPKRMTREQRTELARTVLQACIALSREHGEEIAVSDRPVTQALVGRFTIWLTPWGDVEWLDVWHTGERSAKVVNLRWSGDELEILSFKRPHEWVPELLALPLTGAGARVH